MPKATRKQLEERQRLIETKVSSAVRRLDTNIRALEGLAEVKFASMTYDTKFDELVSKSGKTYSEDHNSTPSRKNPYEDKELQNYIKQIKEDMAIISLADEGKMPSKTRVANRVALNESASQLEREARADKKTKKKSKSKTKVKAKTPKVEEVKPKTKPLPDKFKASIGSSIPSFRDAEKSKPFWEQKNDDSRSSFAPQTVRNPKALDATDLASMKQDKIQAQQSEVNTKIQVKRDPVKKTFDQVRPSGFKESKVGKKDVAAAKSLISEVRSNARSVVTATATRPRRNDASKVQVKPPRNS